MAEISFEAYLMAIRGSAVHLLILVDRPWGGRIDARRAAWSSLHPACGWEHELHANASIHHADTLKLHGDLVSAGLKKCWIKETAIHHWTKACMASIIEIKLNDSCGSCRSLASVHWQMASAVPPLEIANSVKGFSLHSKWLKTFQPSKQNPLCQFVLNTTNSTNNW